MNVRVIATEQLFNGRTLHVVRRRLEVDGEVIEREAVLAPDQAIVVPVNPDGTVVLTEAVHAAANAALLAPLVVSVERAADPVATIRSRLSERYHVRDIERIVSLYSSPSVLLGNTTHFVLARLAEPVTNGDAATMTVGEALAAAAMPLASDSRTITALVCAGLRLAEEGLAPEEWWRPSASRISLIRHHMPPASEREVFRGKVVRILEREYIGDEGTTCEILRRNDGVILLAFDEQERLIVSREVVAGLQEPVLSLPGGKISEASIEDDALRELREETGRGAAKLDVLTTIFSDSNVSRKNTYVVARDLTWDPLASGEDEFIESVPMSMDALWPMFLTDYGTTAGTPGVAFLGLTRFAKNAIVLPLVASPKAGWPRVPDEGNA